MRVMLTSAHPTSGVLQRAHDTLPIHILVHGAADVFSAETDAAFRTKLISFPRSATNRINVKSNAYKFTSRRQQNNHLINLTCGKAHRACASKSCFHCFQSCTQRPNWAMKTVIPRCPPVHCRMRPSTGMTCSKNTRYNANGR